MSVVCVWLPAVTEAGTSHVVAAMGQALRCHPGQEWGCWSQRGLGVGLLDLPTAAPFKEVYAPAVTPGGRYWLWMAGEAFAGEGSVEVLSPDHSRTLAFRHNLLGAILRFGADAVRTLDGEYVIVLWDAQERSLMVINDRFGGLPLYWARSRQGFAVAGGVRGVLAAPGVPADPDPDAIREAVTFGGFRLGDRTNVRAVKMVAGGTELTVRDGRSSFRRYWRWADIPSQPPRPLPDLIEATHARWQVAVRARLSGARHPGQTLSGGLDSRAILAEASRHVPSWTAITYGVPHCDDERYAYRAAQIAGATWIFYPLYSERAPDWLDRRTSQIQNTDGLIDLVDLMHLEALPLQAALLDIHLSGYVGDAVSGSTFADIADPHDALQALPYYGGRLGMDEKSAIGRVEDLIAELGDAPLRYVPFAHKLPQSTNRWTAAWRPWFRVRKPFVDYRFFDFCQGLPPRVRVKDRLHERWLRTKFPDYFASIPNQKTGVPILIPQWLLQLERVRRFAWRKVRPAVAGLGLPTRPRFRSYHPDELFWRAPAVRRRIEETILRPDSLSCEILGRATVGTVVREWFDRAGDAIQVIGALYSYEAYHRDLARQLNASGSRAEHEVAAH